MYVPVSFGEHLVEVVCGGGGSVQRSVSNASVMQPISISADNLPDVRELFAEICTCSLRFTCIDHYLLSGLVLQALRLNSKSCWCVCWTRTQQRASIGR